MLLKREQDDLETILRSLSANEDRLSEREAGLLATLKAQKRLGPVDAHLTPRQWDWAWTVYNRLEGYGDD